MLSRTSREWTPGARPGRTQQGSGSARFPSPWAGSLRVCSLWFGSLVLSATSCHVGSGNGAESRPYLLERVDDVAVVQVYADGFDRLTTNDKILAYHLCEAAIAGRDIFLLQKCSAALDVRDLLEEIHVHSANVAPETREAIHHYLTLFWVNNGPHNALTARKNLLASNPSALLAAARAAEKSGALFPHRDGESTEQLVARLSPLLFDPKVEPIVTAKNPEGGKDILEASSCTFYGPGVTMASLEGFDEKYELNSNVVMKGGKPKEEVWRAGDKSAAVPPGHYAGLLENVIHHLEAALPYAPELTRKALEAQIRFYRTGAEEDRVAYDIAWVEDKDSVVDTVNSFVEVYVDPRGKKGSWEGIVSYEDPKKADLIKSLATNAQWFEDHMSYADVFKKKNVKGISARSIDVLVECGDSGPVTPIGINLPNDQNVREEHGSKSVSLANIVEAYEKSTPSSSRHEFAWDEAEVARAEKWQSLTGDLLTNMHEVIGHASGQQDAQHQGDPATWIKEYYSALEEARADLVALYFMHDSKLCELDLIAAGDLDEAALACYEQYTRNGGLQQLRRIREGDQIEEDHMRNRQMVVRWVQANSSAIDERVRDGKHYLVVTDPAAYREAIGRLLALVQEIKSTGSYDRAKKLFDDYGVHFDPALRDEVVARYSTLDVPSYTGFVMPRLTAKRNAAGEVVDVTIDYPCSLEEQMLGWSGRR